MRLANRLLPALFAALAMLAGAAPARAAHDDGAGCVETSEDAPATLARDLEAIVGPMKKLHVLSSEKTDVREFSGVTVLPDGRLAMVDDERGLYVHTPGVGGEFLEFRHDGRLTDLEGITLSSDGRSLIVVSEDEHRLWRLPLHGRGDKLDVDAPEKMGKLPVLDDVPNKGWEGIETLPASSDPDGVERLIGVHEAKPRRIGLFNPDDLHEREMLKLPHALKKKLGDLADLAVDPVSGHLFLLSEETSTLAETRLVRNADGALDLETLAVKKLPWTDGLKPEGIAFAPDGSLYLVSETDRMVRHIAIER